MAHPLEYETTPEGRICIDAGEIIRWMQEEEMRRNPQGGYLTPPDFRDLFVHLSPVIRVELLRAQIKISELSIVQDAVLKAQLHSAEADWATEKALRAERTPRGEKRGA